MNSKLLFVSLSLVFILVISGCAQPKQKSDSDKDCATESVEVVDADGSKTPSADLENSKDKKECFVQFSESDNVFVVFEGTTVKSIYQDVNNDGLYYEEDEDINILNAKEEDEGENAASILNLYYNDQDINPGKYDPKPPKGTKSKSTVSGEDIGIGKGPVAKCGDGVLQSPEQCDPPGGQCQSGSICEAGKCACAQVGAQSSQSTGSGSSGSPSSADTTTQPDKTKSEPSGESVSESPTAKKVQFSVSSKLTGDTQLTSIKLVLPSKKSVSCSSQTFTIKKSSKNNFDLSITGSSGPSIDKISDTYTVDKAGTSKKIGEAAITAGSSQSEISEAKLYSTTEKKSSTCKPSFTIPSGETSIIQLTATAKELTSSTTAAAGNETDTEPATSPTPLASGAASTLKTSATPKPSASTASSTSSPTPTPSTTASATPTPTATTPNCNMEGNVILSSCKCGSQTVSSGYCCASTPTTTACGGGSPSQCGDGVPITTTCTCGGAGYNSGICCSGSWNAGSSCGGVTCPQRGDCQNSPTMIPSGCTQSECSACALQWCSSTSTCSTTPNCGSP